MNGDARPMSTIPAIVETVLAIFRDFGLSTGCRQACDEMARSPIERIVEVAATRTQKGSAFIDHGKPPLKASIKALSVGIPGREKSRATPLA
ncbi:hypothetical protein N0Q90_00190 (plasmid) [Sinorhizobium sp. M103]|uniref:hypothetical protein n=1 Tax=Sinorhizobium sp. M103 TaxID=2976821 RepID=UPI0023D86C9B|nr:hypothetical protein [Sinorhizobium sp. M103]WEJ08790.1 hypothetical protein N0Q90_00190 [Sinorhizobium sp. M103]